MNLTRSESGSKDKLSDVEKGPAAIKTVISGNSKTENFLTLLIVYQL